MCAALFCFVSVCIPTFAYQEVLILTLIFHIQFCCHFLWPIYYFSFSFLHISFQLKPDCCFPHEVGSLTRASLFYSRREMWTFYWRAAISTDGPGSLDTAALFNHCAGHTRTKDSFSSKGIPRVFYFDEMELIKYSLT